MRPVLDPKCALTGATPETLARALLRPSQLRRKQKTEQDSYPDDGLDPYVVEFTGRLVLRELDPLDQFGALVEEMVGKRLTYRDLVAPNGLESGARAVA